MRYINRYVLLMAALALAIGAYATFWSYASKRALQETAGWIAAQRAAGIEISHGELEAVGFPYRISVRIPALVAQDTRGAEAWRLKGNLLGTIQPWNPNHIIVQGDGLRLAAWPPASPPPADADAFAGRSSIILKSGKWERLAFDANDPRIAVPGQVLQGKHAAVSLRRNHGEDKERPDGSIDLAVAGEDLVVPPGLANGFPPAVNRLNATGQLSGDLTSVPAWRESGGIVDFRLLDFLWGRIKVSGDGTVALDREMRPLGAMSATIQGHDAIIDALVTAGTLRGGEAAMAKAALGGLAQRGEGGQPTIKVAISAQDGRLYVGPVPVGRLRPLFP
jgi:hypothetical protein